MQQRGDSRVPVHVEFLGVWALDYESASERLLDVADLWDEVFFTYLLVWIKVSYVYLYVVYIVITSYVYCDTVLYVVYVIPCNLGIAFLDITHF